MPNLWYVTVYSRSGSELRTSPSINLSSYTVDWFLTYMAGQWWPDYITTVSTSLWWTAVSGSENLSSLTGGSTLDVYDVTPIVETVTCFYLDWVQYNLWGGWHSTTTVTLTSAGWSDNEQTVSATWVTASNTVIVSPAPDNIQDYADWGVYASAQWSGTLTFTAETEPENDIVVNVLIMS